MIPIVVSNLAQFTDELAVGYLVPRPNLIVIACEEESFELT
jgi:hypothetical protein